MSSVKLQLLPAPQLHSTHQDEPAVIAAPWGEPQQLIELTGNNTSARTTAAMHLLLQAQKKHELCAWIQHTGGGLYPPDLADNGVDLNALAVVHIPTGEGPFGLLKAAELLLRSGAFGLLVVNLQAPASSNSSKQRHPRGRVAWQSRLHALARKHQASVLFLTNAGHNQDSLGPLVHTRIEPKRVRTASGHYRIEAKCLKNKQGRPTPTPFTVGPTLGLEPSL